MILRSFKSSCNRKFSTGIIWKNCVSKDVRKRFLQYFVKDNGHTFVRSSPVVSYFDPSIPFVNAGVCQFKDILLGDTDVKFPSVANSQKCIRIGGKHDDLSVVGIDSYHHTFFEMLGNWSFGSYFKREACVLAWDLLTKPPFSILPNRLFITYFAGDEDRGLLPDLETRDIWLEIGVPPDRILPFGFDNNFWEMGLTGPCGPCTEIHIACADDACNSHHLVNAGHPTLTELWNIVFVTHNRNQDGVMIPLGKEFVDTGMGFERLVAALQQKTSTYDTDIFVPIFETISKITSAPKYGTTDKKETLDCAYRTVSDYTRMMTVAIADNALPECNSKLRRILRKALTVTQREFKLEIPSYLLCEIANHIAEYYADTYPEVSEKLPQVKQVIKHEGNLLREVDRVHGKSWEKMILEHPSLKMFTLGEYPGLLQAFKFLNNIKEHDGKRDVSTKNIYTLYDTYGLESSVIEHLSRIYGFAVDWNELSSYMHAIKQKSKENSDQNKNFSSYMLDILNTMIKKTDDGYKYEYKRIESNKGVCYEFPVVPANMLAVLQPGKIPLMYNGQSNDIINQEVCIKSDVELGIITDKTNFYCEAGGQLYDTGILEINNKYGEKICFDVLRVENLSGYIVHRVKLSSCSSESDIIKFQISDPVLLTIDADRRINTMRNHTAAHLILSALEKMLTAVFMKYSQVTQDHLIIHFNSFGEEFNNSGLEMVETYVKGLISLALPVQRNTVSKWDLVAARDVSLTPGEVYNSENIHVLSIENSEGITISKTACCGTHVFNTNDIEDICITSLKSHGTDVHIIKAVTGPKATDINVNSTKHLNRVNDFIQNANIILEDENRTVEQLHNLKTEYEKLNLEMNSILDKNISSFSHVMVIKILDSMSLVEQDIKDKHFVGIREELSKEIEKALYDDMGNLRSYVVYFLVTKPEIEAYVSLSFLAQYCKPVPAVIFRYRGGRMQGYCYVPYEVVSENFNAALWMAPVLESVGAKGNVQANQDPRTTNAMVPLNVKPEELEDTINKLIKTASNVAAQHLNKSTDVLNRSEKSE